MWPVLALEPLQRRNGYSHLGERLEGISAASLRTGKRQVEIEKHGELLQGRFLWVPKAVVLTVTFFLAPQLDLHNQGRN